MEKIALIDLHDCLKNSICTFEMSKKLAETTAVFKDTGLVYEPNGSLSDGGWLDSITGCKSLPVVHIGQAINMIADLTDFSNLDAKYLIEDHVYQLTYDGKEFKAGNIVDAILLLWLDKCYIE